MNAGKEKSKAAPQSAIEDAPKYDSFTDLYKDCEIIIALVYPVGTDYKPFLDALVDKFKTHRYQSDTIQVSTEIILPISGQKVEWNNEFERIKKFMDLGNSLRKNSEDSGVLSLEVANLIHKKRADAATGGQLQPFGRQLFLCNSLKNPEEAKRLREVYEEGFYLIAIDEAEDRRIKYLEKKGMTKAQAKSLIDRDKDEKKEKGHGQNTRDTFQMADFFVSIDGQLDHIRNDVDRIVDAIFGHPFITPTFDEYAMYCAFVASLRSADLSRQVGAVVARNCEILAYGTNDCPRFGGGLYWPNESKGKVVDKEGGRDYKRGVDSNKQEQNHLIEEIIEKLGIKDKKAATSILKKTRIKDITEYGRTVHAEMEALLFCARNNVFTRGGTLYTTTFPCHNCAKHIVAAGIRKVIYVEPYPKSKAFEFYSDSITATKKKTEDKVQFLPFVGIGPRKFFDIFSMKLGGGIEIERKNDLGKAVEWGNSEKHIRMRMIPLNYIEKEEMASLIISKKGGKNGKGKGSKGKQEPTGKGTTSGQKKISRRRNPIVA